MGVDLRGGEARVPQRLLHGPDIALPHQPGRKGVSQRVRAVTPSQDLKGGLSHNSLKIL